MSQENVEIVRQVYEAFTRRDFDAALAIGHDSITWGTLFSVETAVLRGKQEIRAAWESQVEALDVRIDLLELAPLDETRVLAVGTWSGRGLDSGVPVEQSAAQVFTVEGGQVRSVETFASKHEAHKALGLSEQDAHADS